MTLKNPKIPVIYFVLILISVAAFFLIEWLSPKTVSWRTTYSPDDKIPYGTYVIYHQLQDLFPGKTIDVNKKSYYELLHKTRKHNTLIVINHDFYIDESSMDALLDYVADGNEVFISALYFMSQLEDTLGFKMKPVFSVAGKNKELTLAGDTAVTQVEKTVNAEFFNSFQKEGNGKESFEILGRFGTEDINFIRFKIGKGTLYLHSTPMAFTNYYILKGITRDYTEKVFSMLSVNNVMWDNYVRRNKFLNRSDLMFIRSDPALRSAFYVGVIWLVLFMLFYGKRRQKTVPVIAPVKNNSLDFADTISKLYLQQHKHKDIAGKQIRYFKDYIRLTYHLTPDFKSEQFKKSLAMRAGRTESETKELLDYINTISTKNVVSAPELLLLNKKIEYFKN